jgi:Uma2 family endonuclease
MRPTLKTAEIVYPESDGKPMAESDLHRDWMITNISRLKRRYAGQRVYVSGNLLIYYVEGNPRRSFAPDTFVVKDCDSRRRKIFKIWEEGKVPNFVLETTSSTTRRQDKIKKKKLYAELKVPEYFLYDPLDEWLDPPLQGFRLAGEDYVRLEPDADGGIVSEQLGILFQLEEGRLAMFDLATGKRLLSDDEAAAEAAERAAEAAERAAKATQRAAEAERRLLEEAAARKALEDELARLRSRQGK